MRKFPLFFALAAISGLAGCLQTDGERALAGAAAGAIIADAFDKSVLTGAALGALAGTYCDDLNVPGCIRR
jgi:osmotically inducible lipoprotein OsmB